MEELTKRQREVIEFIVQYTFENLYQPTLREIGAACNIKSTNGVNDHLRALRRKGYLGKESKTRAFDLKDSALCFLERTDKTRAWPLILEPPCDL